MGECDRVEEVGETSHPIFNLLAVSILNVCADSMHIVDLGVAHHVLGNAIYLLVCTPHYFRDIATAQGRLDQLWARISQQYHHRQSENQLSNLTMSMFINKRKTNTQYGPPWSKLQRPDILPRSSHRSGRTCATDERSTTGRSNLSSHRSQATSTH